MADPLVTAIIPAYNRPKLLREALYSVGEQKYRNLEVIIIDDGSSESLEQVVREFEGRNEFNVNFVRQNNAGPAAARNLGLKISHGDLIAFLDSDDLWYPSMLQSTASILLEHQEIDMVCGGWDMIDESGKAITGVFMPSGLQRFADEDFAKALLIRNRFPIHSVLIRKECFQRFGAFNTELVAFEDWDLWIRMAGRGCRIIFIDVPVARWRIHLGVRRSPSGRAFSVAVGQFFKNLFNYSFIADQYRQFRSGAEILLWLQQASFYFRTNLVEEAIECVHNSERMLSHGPFDIEFFRSFIEASKSLPGGENFQDKVYRVMPRGLRWQLEAEQGWDQVFKKSINHSIGSALLRMAGLVKLVLGHPFWIMKKSIQYGGKIIHCHLFPKTPLYKV